MREFREGIQLRPTVWQSRVLTNTPWGLGKEGETKFFWRFPRQKFVAAASGLVAELKQLLMHNSKEIWKRTHLTIASSGSSCLVLSSSLLYCQVSRWHFSWVKAMILSIFLRIDQNNYCQQLHDNINHTVSGNYNQKSYMYRTTISTKPLFVAKQPTNSSSSSPSSHKLSSIQVVHTTMFTNLPWFPPSLAFNNHKSKQEIDFQVPKPTNHHFTMHQYTVGKSYIPQVLSDKNFCYFAKVSYF